VLAAAVRRNPSAVLGYCEERERVQQMLARSDTVRLSDSWVRVYIILVLRLVLVVALSRHFGRCDYVLLVWLTRAK
jgi:hypothetical protein